MNARAIAESAAPQPLNSYAVRCWKNVVDFANTIVPDCCVIVHARNPEDAKDIVRDVYAFEGLESFSTDGIDAYEERYLYKTYSEFYSEYANRKTL